MGSRRRHIKENDTRRQPPPGLATAPQTASAIRPLDVTKLKQ